MEGGLTVKEAADRLGVTTKTIRRQIEAKQLDAVQVKGKNGPQWLITPESLEKRASRSPVEAGLKHSTTKSTPRTAELAQQVAQLTEEAKRTQALIENQQQLIEELRAEVRDSRGQLGQFQEYVMKALPAPERKKGFWQRLFGRD